MRAQGDDNVEEVPIFHSVDDNFSGSEVVDDHGIINFEDEYPSVAFALGNGDVRTGYFSNEDRRNSKILCENGEETVVSSTFMAGMEYCVPPETSRGANLTKGHFLIIDFD